MEQKEILEYLKRSLDNTIKYEDEKGSGVKYKESVDGIALMHRIESLIDILNINKSTEASTTFGNSKLCNKCNKVGSNCVCSYMIRKDEVRKTSEEILVLLKGDTYKAQVTEKLEDILELTKTEV